MRYLREPLNFKRAVFPRNDVVDRLPSRSILLANGIAQEVDDLNAKFVRKFVVSEHIRQAVFRDALPVREQVDHWHFVALSGVTGSGSGLRRAPAAVQQPGFGVVLCDTGVTRVREERVEKSPNSLSLNGGPCWNRTNDHLIKSQMLYRLS